MFSDLSKTRKDLFKTAAIVIKLRRTANAQDLPTANIIYWWQEGSLRL